MDERLTKRPVDLPGLANRSGATTDDEIIKIWLRTGRRRSRHTRRAYRTDAESLLGHLRAAGKSLQTATVDDVQTWVDSLAGASSSRARYVGSMKSLFSFAQKTGYLVFNVGTVIDRPEVPNKLAERILPEEQVWSMLRTMEGRCGLLVRFLYASGVRIHEACGMILWEHVHSEPDGTVRITIHGKGGRTRHIIVQEAVAQELLASRGDAPADAPIFRTRTGEPFHPANAAKCVRAAAHAAGIDLNVSPHWLRHAHGSHAVDRGAPLSTVQQSLGHASLATTGKYLHVRPKDSAGLYLKI